jgi:signal transduction histidine kinase
VKRRQPSMAALVVAAAIVVACLAALVIFPYWLARRMERNRADIDRHAIPSRAALHEINYRLAHQIASVTRAMATGNPQHIDAYQRAIEPQRSAIEALARHRGAMGPAFDAHFAQLQHRINDWHASVEQTVDSHKLADDANYPGVIEAIDNLDDAITAFQSSVRQESRRLSRLQLRVSAGLLLLAGVAASIVIWMISRLRALARELEKESEERRAALERERELLRIRDEILGVVSHDLRSPLTTVTLSTQLIPDSTSEEQKEHVETILATTRRMQRLIQDLLDVTKTDSRRLSIQRELIDPKPIIDEVIASHEPIAESKQIQLASSIDDALPRINGDGDRLAQALTNLLGNAMKFTPAGGTVRLSVRHSDGKVRFEVADSGPGIAPSDLPHLFEPFWQAKKTAHLGAGLGLKITRAIVEAHDGSIGVSNVPGGGACFAFELPTGPVTARLLNRP